MPALKTNYEEIKLLCVKKFLVPFEGYAKKLPNGDCTAYPDPGPTGLPITIGFGNTTDENGVAVKMGDVWTYNKALYVKSKILDKFLVQLELYSPGLFQEPTERISAVLSFVYNVGLGAYAKSTFRKYLDTKDWMMASIECLKWDKAKGVKLKGLTKRREAEASSILNPKI